ncbi:MAG: HAD family phosphatase [Bacteroidales bacterium]|nr:HAD family phosphatase [Bacteroidales bacterium]
MTKAVVFDIGGVIIGLDLERGVRTFKEVLGYERITELLDPCHQKGIFGAMEGGEISADEFRARVLEESRPGSTAEQVDRCVRSILNPVTPETAAAVRSVYGRYPLYLLSNNNPIGMPACLELMEKAGIGGLYEDMFVSSEMKMLKPSLEFYREAVRRIGLPPEEILFIDDSLTNVEAARALGIDARWLEPGMPLSQLLP